MAPETFDLLDQDSLRPLVLQLLAQNNKLLQQIKTLLARIAELEARTGQSTASGNSSRCCRYVLIRAWRSWCSVRARLRAGNCR